MTWLADALCAQVGGDVSYPEHGSSPDASRRVCQRFPVRDDCREWAIAARIGDGMWGGLTTGELDTERQRRTVAIRRSP